MTISKTRNDFSEVGHTGGKVTFTIESDADGFIRYQIDYSGTSRFGPMTLVGVYAHPDGFACGNIKLGGIGQRWNPAPFPNCIAVMMASDSEGRFGHECPSCKKHFRSESIPANYPLSCPYCGLKAESFHFLTPPQKVYVTHYVKSLQAGISEINPSSTKKVVINMDAIADSITDEPRPDFYYTSTAQQTEFNCSKCNSYNDIRGKYGYCSSCGWRNSAEIQRIALKSIREKLVGGALSSSDAVKQAVSEFDSAARDFLEQLTSRVPMKKGRKNELQSLLFHNMDKFPDLLKRCFNIDLLDGMSSADQ